MRFQEDGMKMEAARLRYRRPPQTLLVATRAESLMEAQNALPP
jgi:hypothetical protein